MPDHPFEYGHLPFGWEVVPDYWPQRLIYIPTMISIPRDDDNVYRFGDVAVKEPEYSILSYTWGRWRIKDDLADGAPALPVKNTTWMIPPVKEEHFTVQAFQKVVSNIQLGGTDWVWIDVGCIDQRRGDENTQAAIEIGRQASIFKQARNTFVWLSRLQNAQLQSALDDIQDYGIILDDYIYYHKTIDIDHTIDKLQSAISAVFADPWFSSLWTLQEIVLRNDAVVLSTEGEPVLWMRGPGERRTYMTMFINHCQNVYKCLDQVESRKISQTNRPLSAETSSGIQCIMKGILSAGFYYLFSTNPNVQYGTARYRTTSRDEDRIYAIMQIYNLRVGKSARPGENPPLEELVTEFAGSINQRSAILGQFFVHSARPKDGLTWQITGNSTVPDSLMIYRNPNNLATIQIDKVGNCIAAGSYCQFLILLGALANAGEMNPSSTTNGWGLHFRLYLDHPIRGSHTFQTPNTSYHLERKDGDFLTQIDCQKLRVLLLGDVDGSWSTKSNKQSRDNVGLLIHAPDRSTEEGLEGAWCERLGIITWTTDPDLPCEPIDKIKWQSLNQIVLR